MLISRHSPQPGVFVSLIIIVLTLAVFFLGSEMLKKFNIFQHHVKDSNQLLSLSYRGAGEEGFKKGMKTITIHWDRPFGALVGFNLKVPFFAEGFDYYGRARSVPTGFGGHDLTISTYLGNGKVDFLFYLNRELSGQQPIFSYGDENEKASATFPPHWWQRLGFYA